MFNKNQRSSCVLVLNKPGPGIIRKIPLINSCVIPLYQPINRVVVVRFIKEEKICQELLFVRNLETEGIKHRI